MIKNVSHLITGMPGFQPGISHTQQGDKSSFMKTLSSFVEDVNDMQFQAKEINEAFIRGDIEDLHQVTIAQEKARIGMELLMEIRNKLLEGYQEIMRMQI
ncbi:MAG: flagellar hook-basal body complex protein FliE [Calditrichia bacterium]